MLNACTGLRHCDAMLGRKEGVRAEPDLDPDLAELRAADAEYHAV